MPIENFKGNARVSDAAGIPKENSQQTRCLFGNMQEKLRFTLAPRYSEELCSSVLSNTPPDQGPDQNPPKCRFWYSIRRSRFSKPVLKDHGFSEEAHANQPLYPFVCFCAFIHGSIPHCPCANGPAICIVASSVPSH